MSLRARGAYQTVADDPLFERIAIHRVHPVAQVLAAFLLGVTGRKHLRLFSNRDEAMAWLRADRET